MPKASELPKSSVLAIDIGGTGIKASIVDLTSAKLVGKHLKISTPQPSTPESVLSEIENIISILQWDGDVGCGFPGVIKKGFVNTAANMSNGWIGINIYEEIKRISNGRVAVINDADAAGLAEMKYGAGREFNCHNGGVVLIITLGTGIGSALFVDGHLVHNTEFGHIEIDGVDAEKRAATVIRESEGITWEEWGKRVNIYLRTMEKLLSPDVLIIGGGVSESPEKFFPYIIVKAKIVPAQMGNDAGIVGAAFAIEYLHNSEIN